MGRKRIDLGPDANGRIEAMLNAGMASDAIARQLKISPATVRRRVAELKGKVPPKFPTLASAPAPSPNLTPADQDAAPPDDEQVPDGTSVSQIKAWLEIARERAAEAAGRNDVDNHVKYLRLAATLLEALRKATPVPKPDPNEHPDMVEAAARVRERWHKLADSLVRVSKSPVAETIAKMLKKQNESDP